MLITLPNADFSGTGLGKVQRMINGMPQASLSGLWLFDDGGNGDVVGAVTDKSGLGHAATLRSGWVGGARASFGMNVARSAGTALMTDVPINPVSQIFTVFFAGKFTLFGNTPGEFIQVMGSTDNAGMEAEGTNHLNNPALVMNYVGTGPNGYWQIFDANNDMMGATILTQVNSPTYDEATVAGVQIDGNTGTVTLHVLGASSVSLTDPRTSAFYDGATDRGNLEIGVWPHGSQRPTSPNLAEVYGVAAYERTFTQSEAQEYMRHLQKIAEKRGVVF